ncbi:TorF family putative porin [Sphingosinicella sp. LHD-64]|uniref:TorF family putative porin n=1 Tax=Sphingosinicella sp. LHD-64 TaxID=3072139 RepID=UPI00280DAA05|nr:TorF family putative porin [Sphingosinicella sp. LHD-64]MDQ8756269.1 TorF family putative porin [Sphingosinicella sp. LHD-64]
MRIKTLVHTAICSLSLAAVSPAFAAELGSGFTINGGATLVSDYRFRGISQTDKRFAVQGTFTLGHASGLYATVWGSSIDDYVAAGSDQEIDFILGYRRTFGATTIDAGLLYYYYPGSSSVVPGYSSDFFEPYVSVSHTFGPVTAKVTANYAWSQSALSIGNGNEDNLYLAGDLSASLGSGFAVSGHLGHSFGPSYLTIGDEYTDWNLGVSYTTGPLTLGVQYVDTDGDYLTPTGRNASGSGVVGSVGVSF